ncbi:hypothetical protein JKP88DRAFT_290668 [Tribonema minus]|uniref:Uncharacterized protein n=1 Tax=Tribonema minus TaxID=303371 RepID=A0A835YV01_9STRA|nr:hypothetical protein JKP88DRAFT_290668 [Tribonema minus]
MNLSLVFQAFLPQAIRAIEVVDCEILNGLAAELETDQGVVIGLHAATSGHHSSQKVDLIRIKASGGDGRWPPSERETFAPLNSKDEAFYCVHNALAATLMEMNVQPVSAYEHATRLIMDAAPDYVPDLTTSEIAECSRFGIGQFVEISDSYEFAGDWKNTICQVIGVRWDERAEKPDYSLLHDGDQITTGFLPADLSPSSRHRPGASDLVELALQRAERAISQHRDTMTPGQIAAMIFVSPAVQDFAILEGLSARRILTDWSLIETWKRDLDEMHVAPGASEGMHAQNWADKPHRVLYDAIRIARRAIDALSAVQPKADSDGGSPAVYTSVTTPEQKVFLGDVRRDIAEGTQWFSLGTVKEIIRALDQFGDRLDGRDGATLPASAVPDLPAANLAAVDWAFTAAMTAGVSVTYDDVSAIVGCYLTSVRAGAIAQRQDRLHPDTAAMLWAFAAALWSKLLKAQQKYDRSNDWKTDDWEAECRADLRRHVEKGDPLDVAAYAAFCWARGWSTRSLNEAEAAVTLSTALKAIEDRAATVCPNPVLGDDDSIHLTPLDLIEDEPNISPQDVFRFTDEMRARFDRLDKQAGRTPEKRHG